MVYCIEPKGEFRKILMYTLESCGYTSEAIPSGKELLEVLKQHRPELILLDYDLPGEKGLDILDILRDSWYQIQMMDPEKHGVLTMGPMIICPGLWEK